ncbi:hypothetical protein B0O99DRAFT_623487 [Bisporella sp. PMI_857]|nr:hypothetical protein B0O99DRAFT_623487 [Bisporella sp. PMI_857]
MFASVGQLGPLQNIPQPTDTKKKLQLPTPLQFPTCAPVVTGDTPISSYGEGSLVSLLQKIQRPADIQQSHFEALGVHVISASPPRDILPDASYLPPFAEWTAVGQDELEAATTASKRPLSNGNLSPGIQTYQERRKELLIDNRAAFRTVRRIPAPPGESLARLGNAYEFFKNLELFSGYWQDTSLPPSSEEDEPKHEENLAEKETAPRHLQTHVRLGNGAQLPPEYRQQLLTAFTKLVAYDFGCNVSFARCEPRLILTPPSALKPSSYFNSSASFIYRTPTDRASARSGIVEGPVAAISCRTTTTFTSPLDSNVDFSRELIALLLTAQQRARSTTTETRFGEGKWWTSVPRWGGGPGGPIGREVDILPPPSSLSQSTISASSSGPSSATAGEEEPRGRSPRPGPAPAKRSKRPGKDGNLQIYENYRKMLPPSSTWDRKTRYSAIGKKEGATWDDVFLVSALNHHVCVMRARVPRELLGVFGGGDGTWDGVKVWRSRWFDLFLPEERVEGMELIWGMMAWLMRSTEGEMDTS